MKEGFAENRGRWLLDVRRAVLLAAVFAYTFAPLLLRRIGGKRAPPKTIGARVRKAFERLGVTYIKLGQFLAMRFDILPEEVCRELANLFDDVPPMPYPVVVRTIAEELGGAPENVFGRFEDEPLAAASIAQVHRAALPDGTRVAVKVQRPRIREIFAADIRNLKRLARIGDALGVLGPQSTRDAVEEFERFTSREMDFTIEARTAERLRENAGPFEEVPRVHRAFTSGRVLTLDFVDAPSLAQIVHGLEDGNGKLLERLEVDAQIVIENLADATLRQLFVTGFFHADPHPGNILIRPDGTVVFVDFGIFGQLAPERRETFATYIENVSLGNVPQAYRHFVRLLQPTAATDPQQLRRDVYAIMRGWYDASRESGAPLAERHLGKFISEFIEAIRNNKVRMGLDTLLFWRALLVLDATALRFKSQFDLLGHLRRFFERERPSFQERMLDLATDPRIARRMYELAHAAPADALETLEIAQSPRPLFAIRPDDAPQRARRHNEAARQITAATIAAAMLVLITRGTLTSAGEVTTWIGLATSAALWMRRAAN
jgi:ubiquinone biosynthesis protein